jgi:hypothetical protein
MKADTTNMNEAAADLAEASAPAPVRPANPDKLKSLLKELAKTAKIKSETEALRPRLEAEIKTAQESGDILDESLAASIQTKRSQLEMVGPKLDQIQRRREKLLSELKDEFVPCMNSFERQFTGVVDVVKRRIESFLAPLMEDDNMLSHRVGAFLMPHAKLPGQFAGLISAIKFHIGQNDFPAAARRLLDSKEQADAVLLEATKIGKQSK